MPKKQNSQSSISWTSGNISGSQIVIGDGNTMIRNEAPPVSQAELKKLRREFAVLKKSIQATAPPEQKDEALDKVDELQEALLSEKPNASAAARARDWFMKNLPSVAGAVTSVVVNPIVGKLVAAAGDAVASEFRHRFGGA